MEACARVRHAAFQICTFHKRLHGACRECASRRARLVTSVSLVRCHISARDKWRGSVPSVGRSVPCACAHWHPRCMLRPRKPCVILPTRLGYVPFLHVALFRHYFTVLSSCKTPPLRAPPYIRIYSIYKKRNSPLSILPPSAPPRIHLPSPSANTSALLLVTVTAHLRIRRPHVATPLRFLRPPNPFPHAVLSSCRPTALPRCANHGL